MVDVRVDHLVAEKASPKVACWVDSTAEQTEAWLVVPMVATMVACWVWYLVAM